MSALVKPGTARRLGLRPASEARPRPYIRMGTISDEDMAKLSEQIRKAMANPLPHRLVTLT